MFPRIGPTLINIVRCSNTLTFTEEELSAAKLFHHWVFTEVSVRKSTEIWATWSMYDSYYFAECGFESHLSVDEQLLEPLQFASHLSQKVTLIIDDICSHLKHPSQHLLVIS